MSDDPTTAMRYDGAPQRRDAILVRLLDKGFSTVATLADDLGVSEQTVRRDLRRLQDAGHVEVVHGGASAMRQPTPPTAHFATRFARNADAKRRIAALAATLIDPDDTIALDSGTTPFALAEALPTGYRGTVVTASIPVIQHLLHRDVDVIGLGGNAVANREAFAGPMTLQAASRVRVRTMFLGAEGADDRGLYIIADGNPDVQLQLMDNADRSVLLIDHTKFERPAPVLLAGFHRIHAVVTDCPPPADVTAAIHAAGTRLHVADHSIADDHSTEDRL